MTNNKLKPTKEDQFKRIAFNFPFPIKFSFHAILTISLSLLVISLWINVKYSRPTITQMNHGHSAAFHGRHVPDPLLPPDIGQAMKINPNQHTFQFEVPKDLKVFNLELLYQCHPECSQVRLIVGDNQQFKQHFLLSHPIFSSLHWFHVETDIYRLYQPQIQFDSISTLLTSKHPISLLTEAHLQSRLTQTPHQLSYLEFNTQITTQSAILTTYRPSQKIGNWQKVNRTIQLSPQADYQSLYWKIQTSPPYPDATIWISQAQIKAPHL